MKREKTKYKGIYKVGDNYYITFYVGTKLVEKKIGPDLSYALQEKIDRETRAKHGKYEIIKRQEKMTFKDLMTLYEKDADKKEYIVARKQIYLAYFNGWKLSQITRKDLFDFRDKVRATPKQRGEKPVTDSTVNRALAGLRRLLNFAVNRQMMEESPFPRNPKSGLFYPERIGFRRFFTQEQVIQIIRACPDWLRPIVLTGYYTGMRLGEILKLRWEHVSLTTGVINLPSSKTLKDPTGLGQRVVMHEELVKAFGELSNGSEWVFVNPDGLPFEVWYVGKAFKKVLKELGFEQYSFKEMRHTTGSIMNLKGADPMAIKDQLRHTDFKTTQDYYIGSDIEYQREQIRKITLVIPEAEA